jgi:segregation and condensation protein B
MVKKRARKSGPKPGHKAPLKAKGPLKAPPRVQDLPAPGVADDELADASEAEVDELDDADASEAEVDELDDADASEAEVDELEADADASEADVAAEADDGSAMDSGAGDEPAADVAAEADDGSAMDSGAGDEPAAEAAAEADDGSAMDSGAGDEPAAEAAAGPGDEPGSTVEESSSGASRAASGPSASPDLSEGAAEADPDDPLAAMLAEFDAPRPSAPAGVKLSDELPIDPEDDLRQVEGEASPRLVSIIESLLFAAAKPLRVQDLRKVLAETSKQQIQLALKHLMAITVERGVVLAQVAGGFQYRTHPDNAVWVQKMLQARPARLSRTQIETLAIVAYRQPITRPEIDDVRGVDSGAVLKTLLERDLIQIVGRKEEPGRPLLYGTTVRFLEFFNLRSLRDLPTLRDFRDLSEESKATLRARLGQTEAEALGQGVLGLAGGDEASADDVDEPAADQPDEVAVKDEAATDGSSSLTEEPPTRSR